MGADFFGARFLFPKQKPVSLRSLIETCSLSTSQPMLFSTELQLWPDTVGAMLTLLQAAAVPAEQVTAPGLYCFITLLLLIWSGSLLHRLVLIDADWRSDFWGWNNRSLPVRPFSGESQEQRRPWPALLWLTTLKMPSDLLSPQCAKQGDMPSLGMHLVSLQSTGLIDLPVFLAGSIRRLWQGPPPQHFYCTCGRVCHQFPPGSWAAWAGGW